MAQRIDAEGEVVWVEDSLTIDSTFIYARGSGKEGSAISDGTGGVIYACCFSCFQENRLGAFVMRLDAGGNIMWHQILFEREHGLNDLGCIVKKTSNGRYFVSWDDSLPILDGQNDGVMCLNIDGEMLWDSPVILGDTLAKRLSFLAFACSNSVNYIWQHNDAGPALIKGQHLNLEGETVWEYGGVTLDRGHHYTMAITSDCHGGAIIATDSFPIELYMVNRRGELGIVIDDFVSETNATPAPDFEVSIYPQPANSSLNICLPTTLLGSESVVYKIFDLAGRLMWRGQLFPPATESVPLTDFSSGIYLIQFDTPKALLNRKFLIQK